MSPSFEPPATKSSGLWVPAALLAFALLLALGPMRFESVVSAPARVPAWAADTTPVREPSARPEYVVAVYTYRCSECHAILSPPPEPRGALVQHTEVVLEHGMNTNCFNCHHRTNRDAFVDDFGREIPWDQPQLLCGKCHGPVFRDWEHGSHGRTNGYWDTSRGPQTRVKCIQCHDPHRPPFPPMRPAPRPHTLRLGHRDYGPHAAEHDPLRLGRQAAAKRPDDISAQQ